ncbi:MAG TPA: hypothetical protein LFV90_05785 [Rickettsia endosymbiont of Columbicola hoogstraali]|nr:hypothetical protein [Rickettsia endosymbiont of Columbicola hoogstraali]
MSDTKKVAINLNDSNEDILAFIGDTVSDMFGGTKAMFTLLKSINNFNDIFSDQEVIVEDFYPSTHSNDIFTTAYNIIGFVGYTSYYPRILVI